MGRYDRLMDSKNPVVSTIGHVNNALASGEDFDNSHLRASDAEKNLHAAKKADADALRGNIASQQKDAGRNKGSIYSGMDGADFWQGSSENLKGVTNATNRANLGAELGTAHSVMDDKGRQQGAQEKLGKNQQLGQNFAEAKGQESQAKSSDASMALEGQMHESDMQNRELDRAQKKREQSRKLIAGMVKLGVGIATGGSSLLASNGMKTVAGWFKSDSVGGNPMPPLAPTPGRPSEPSMMGDAGRNLSQSSGGSPLIPTSPLMQRTGRSLDVAQMNQRIDQNPDFWGAR